MVAEIPCVMLTLFCGWCIQHHLLPQPTRVKYTSINDELVLEDFVQRVMLTGDIPTHQLVTGEACDGEEREKTGGM